MNKILVVFIVLVQALVAYSFANGTQVTKGGFAVQNTDAALSADITIEFFNPDGSREHQIARTIAPHSSLFFNLDNVTELTPGWTGSAMITSEIEVVGAGWTEAFSKYGKPEGLGWYNLPSSKTAGSSVYVPLVRKDQINGFEYKLWLQNTGSATATLFVTYYTLGGGNTYASTCSSLAPRQSLDLINSCTASLPDSFVGSAVIYSDQPIVVVANQSNPSKMTECLFNGISGTEGYAQLFFPIVQNNYLGWFSSFTVQNMGVSQDQGDFEYRPDCTNACGWESPLPSAAINPDYGYMFTPVTSSFSGYGIFTSLKPEPFGSVVRAWNDNAMTSYCHNGFGGGTTFPVPEGNTWFLPWVNDASRIVVKNTNDSTGRTVNVNWQGVAGKQTLNLAANDKQVIIPAVPGGWSGSGVVQSSDGDLPLAIVVQNAQAGGNDNGAYNVYGDNHGALQLFIPHVSKAQQFLPTIWKFYNPAILKGAEK